MRGTADGAHLQVLCTCRGAVLHSIRGARSQDARRLQVEQADLETKLDIEQTPPGLPNQGPAVMVANSYMARSGYDGAIPSDTGSRHDQWILQHADKTGKAVTRRARLMWKSGKVADGGLPDAIVLPVHLCNHWVCSHTLEPAGSLLLVAAVLSRHLYVLLCRCASESTSS